ncbi:hypothetical protein [Natronococcus sp. A-GB7]|uniref:DUF7344 domain-containing protein n=1 Tax=Natronococcus sp. A-GB7 TaxID=3037649 RepID=UPI00241E7819|nr:hypothetical protein [Natronococcus sp. A-GB7]MDG5820644.1 hypothetical protein [Natronococcus sp. A-GB7]
MDCDRDSYSKVWGIQGLPGEETILEALADPIRWATMASLLEGESPRPVADLADEVADRVVDGTEDRTHSSERVREALVHVHVPTLAEADLASYDRADGRVAPGENADRIVELARERDGFPEALPALTDPRGRAALSLLASRDEPLSLEGLGRRLREERAVEIPLETLLIELHHRHLPKLAAHSLVDYDAERHTVLPLEKANELRFVDDE